MGENLQQSSLWTLDPTLFNSKRTKTHYWLTLRVFPTKLLTSTMRCKLRGSPSQCQSWASKQARNCLTKRCGWPHSWGWSTAGIRTCPRISIRHTFSTKRKRCWRFKKIPGITTCITTRSICSHWFATSKPWPSNNKSYSLFSSSTL